MKSLKFFCADCSSKFNSAFRVTEMQWGQQLISSECACPKCGGWNSYPDTTEGHADELRHALEYDSELIAQEADDDQ